MGAPNPEGRSRLTLVEKADPRAISFTTEERLRDRFPGVLCTAKVESSYIQISAEATAAELIASGLTTAEQMQAIPKCGQKLFGHEHPLARGLRSDFKRRAKGRWSLKLIAYKDKHQHKAVVEIYRMFGTDLAAKEQRDRREYLPSQLRWVVQQLQLATTLLDVEWEGYKFSDADRARLKPLLLDHFEQLSRHIQQVESVSTSRPSLQIVSG